MKNDTSLGKEWISTKDAADYIGLKLETFKLLVALKVIRCSEQGGKRRFNRGTLDAWYGGDGDSTQRYEDLLTAIDTVMDAIREIDSVKLGAELPPGVEWTERKRQAAYDSGYADARSI